MEFNIGGAKESFIFVRLKRVEQNVLFSSEKKNVVFFILKMDWQNTEYIE